MSGVYESIVAGLNEAIEDAKCAEPKLKRRIVTIMPVKEYEPEEFDENAIVAIINPKNIDPELPANNLAG